MAVPVANQGQFTLVSDLDLHLFNEGSHNRLYEKFGAHLANVDGASGTYFAVWAPNAETVSVIGDFNGWKRDRSQLRARGNSGVWEGFLPGIGEGAIYKYAISSRYENYQIDKSDPYGFRTEVPPRTGSIVHDLNYQWTDGEWMQSRAGRNSLQSPISIYEAHLGSWMRVPEDGNRSLTYRELAPRLGDYLQRMNFTHVEFLPIMEHPFYGSWGYQSTGFFAPTSRYGTPQDFMFLVEQLHRRGIGIILDWVPSHFPDDAHGLAFFDGTHLYEHADRRQGFHPEWHSHIFNYGRNEVRSFLLSSALFWLDIYHLDGLRVDAVASMLYLDYGRKEGEWIPNKFGGRENLDAISFLQRMNHDAYEAHPEVQTIAEESTTWPLVSRPNYLGGLGFGLKWDMGWMHDTLQYFSKDPIYRRFHHNLLTFRGMYMFSENYVLPLSHDEIVYGKGSLLAQMSGDEWQKFANLRLLFGYMYSQPGKKLLFMGSEFGQRNEWYHETSLDWHLLDSPMHSGMLRWVEDLNRTYRTQPALFQEDFSPAGFEWIDANDSDESILTYIRRSSAANQVILAVCNFTPVPRYNYRIGVPRSGVWREILNSDATLYGGSGQGNMGAVETDPVPFHGRPSSLALTVPPLGLVFFAWQGQA
jgi:1,4-alpha-glucan branching enzyme